MIGIAFTKVLNDALGDPTSTDYERAQQSSAQAERIIDSVEDLGILNRLDSPSEIAEARAVLGAIPPAVDRAILGALRSAFERQAPVRVAWVQGEGIEVQISEQSLDDVVGVHIVFRSPPGQTLR